MNEWIAQLGTFLIQGIMVTLLVVLAGLVLVRGKRSERDMTLHVTSLNEQRRARNRRLRVGATAQSARKKLIKHLRREEKVRHKSAKKREKSEAERLWVLDFNGDIKASRTAQFAQEVSAVIEVATEHDEVMIRLESGGGLVHAYGLASAELARLREAGLRTTVCIDKVAASGGYMMACTAHHIKAAPFAVIGSIGVVAQVPNIHRLLKNHDIDVEMLTAGRYKRTLTVLGENTDEGRARFIDDLENTHRLFKEYVARHRPDMDIERLATGEIWYGSEALGERLVDSLGTSEAYLVERMKNVEAFGVKLEPPKTAGRRISLAISAGVERAITKVLGALEATGWQRR